MGPQLGPELVLELGLEPEQELELEPLLVLAPRTPQQLVEHYGCPQSR